MDSPPSVLAGGENWTSTAFSVTTHLGLATGSETSQMGTSTRLEASLSIARCRNPRVSVRTPTTSVCPRQS